MADHCVNTGGAGRWNDYSRGFKNYRRIVVRYERHPENFLGMLHLACCLILLRWCLCDDF